MPTRHLEFSVKYVSPQTAHGFKSLRFLQFHLSCPAVAAYCIQYVLFNMINCCLLYQTITSISRMSISNTRMLARLFIIQPYTIWPATVMVLTVMPDTNAGLVNDICLAFPRKP